MAVLDCSIPFLINLFFEMVWRKSRVRVCVSVCRAIRAHIQLDYKAVAAMLGIKCVQQRMNPYKAISKVHENSGKERKRERANHFAKHNNYMAYD